MNPLLTAELNERVTSLKLLLEKVLVLTPEEKALQERLNEEYQRDFERTSAVGNQLRANVQSAEVAWKESMKTFQKVATDEFPEQMKAAGKDRSKRPSLVREVAQRYPEIVMSVDDTQKRYESAKNMYVHYVPPPIPVRQMAVWERPVSPGIAITDPDTFAGFLEMSERTLFVGLSGLEASSLEAAYLLSRDVCHHLHDLPDEWADDQSMDYE